MKKTIRVIKTRKNKVYEPKLAKCKVNITHINTDRDIVYALAVAKLNADREINASEFNTVFYTHVDAYSRSLDSFMNAMKNEYFRFNCESKWANRPWYEKLLFWRKKPTCKMA